MGMFVKECICQYKLQFLGEVCVYSVCGWVGVVSVGVSMWGCGHMGVMEDRKGDRFNFNLSVLLSSVSVVGHDGTQSSILPLSTTAWHRECNT